MLSTSVHSLATCIPAVGSVWPFAPGFCSLGFPIMMLAWTLELWARINPFSLKMLLLRVFAYSSSRMTMVSGKELLPQASIMGMAEARRNPCKTRCLQLVAGGQKSCQGQYEARHLLVLSVTLSSVECLVQEQPDYFIIS